MFSSKALLVALTALAVPVAANPIPAPTTGCASVHFITARGSTEAQGEGPMSTVIDCVVSNSTQTVSREAVDYPATLTNYPSSEAQGVSDMKAKLAAKTSACPNTKIVLTGYSQGAQVTGDVLVQKATGTDHVYGGLLMGDPAHVHGESFQKGTANAYNGIYARAPGTLEGSAAQLASYCDIGDPYCASGLNETVHHTYFTTYGNAACVFALGRIGG